MSPVTMNNSQLGQIILDLRASGAEPVVLGRMAYLQIGKEPPATIDENIGRTLSNVIMAGATAEVIGRFIQAQIFGSHELNTTSPIESIQLQAQKALPIEPEQRPNRTTKKFTINGHTSVTIKIALLEEFLKHWNQNDLRSILKKVAKQEVPVGQNRSFMVQAEIEKQIRTKQVLPHGLSVIQGGGTTAS